MYILGYLCHGKWHWDVYDFKFDGLDCCGGNWRWDVNVTNVSYVFDFCHGS